MTLHQLVSALKNPDVRVCVIDEGEDLIKFYADGIESVKDEILQRTVAKWEITTITSIHAYLESA